MINIYEEITNRILVELDKGEIPWQKPWKSIIGAVSHTTGKPYSFLNQIMLADWGSPLTDKIETEYVPEYLTFKQVKAEGGNIKKGEKSKMVVFWKVIDRPVTNIETGEVETIMVPYLRYYHVFEVSQCEGIERKHNIELTNHAPIEVAEKIVNHYFNREACTLNVCLSDRAFYQPLTDTVTVPMLNQYEYAEEYYSTLFHEMTHSTGHKTRLDRFTNGSFNFGNDVYSKEELVAELGSAFMMNRAGINSEHSFKNTTAYIQSWSRKLREDNRLFVYAAGKAEKAVDYIINGKKEKEEK